MSSGIVQFAFLLSECRNLEAVCRGGWEFLCSTRSWRRLALLRQLPSRGWVPLMQTGLRPEDAVDWASSAVTSDGSFRLLLGVEGQAFGVLLGQAAEEFTSEAWDEFRGACCLWSESLTRHSQALQQREWCSSVEKALELAGAGSWFYDSAADRFQATSRGANLLGLPVLGQADLAAGLANVCSLDRAAVHAAIRGCGDVCNHVDIECSVRPLGQEVRRLRLTGVALHPETGEFNVMGVACDVTEKSQHAEALQRNSEELRAMGKRLVHIQEAERRRLAVELHDKVGQNLTALGISLELVRRGIASRDFKPRELERRLVDAHGMVDQTSAIISNVMAELRPPMLDDYGLLAALEWYGAIFERRTGLLVQVRLAGTAIPPAPERDLALFRIAQEALNNVLKHARANRIDIQLGREPEGMTMVILDDGRGFAPTSDSSAKGRLGMRTMRERAMAVRGELEVHSGPDKGCCLTVRVPW